MLTVFQGHLGFRGRISLSGNSTKKTKYFSLRPYRLVNFSNLACAQLTGPEPFPVNLLPSPSSARPGAAAPARIRCTLVDRRAATRTDWSRLPIGTRARPDPTGLDSTALS